MNKCQWEGRSGKISTAFNLYQAKNGAIYIMLGNSATKLEYKQIEELKINVYEDIDDFNFTDFKKYYRL